MSWCTCIRARGLNRFCHGPAHSYEINHTVSVFTYHIKRRYYYLLYIANSCFIGKQFRLRFIDEISAEVALHEGGMVGLQLK